MYLNIMEIKYEDGKKYHKESKIESKKIVETWACNMEGNADPVISFEFDDDKNDRIFHADKLRADGKEVVIYYLNDTGQTIGCVRLGKIKE